jgi:hypothetical protein
MSSHAERNAIIALLVSPAVAPAGVFVYTLLSGVPVRESLVIASIYALFTYAGTVLLGLPAHHLRSKLGLRSWWHYAVAGAAPGVPVQLPFLIGRGHSVVSASSVAIFATFGAVTAAVFGMISQRQD